MQFCSIHIILIPHLLISEQSLARFSGITGNRLICGPPKVLPKSHLLSPFKTSKIFVPKIIHMLEDKVNFLQDYLKKL